MKLFLPKNLLKLLFVVMLFVGQIAFGQTVVSHTFSGTSGVIDSNISFSTEKNTSANAPAFNTELRLYYASASPYHGCSITLTPASGVTITAVEVYGLSSYTPTLRYTIGAATITTSNPPLTLSGTTYSVSGLSVLNTTLKIRNANTSNTQGRLTGLKVTYIPAGPSIPTVSTTTVSSITTSSASSGGNVSANGGASITARGVAFSTSANPTLGTSDGSSTGTFTSSLTSLSLNTQYFYRAFATNSVGAAYGSEFNFYTLAATPGLLVVNNPQLTTLDVTVNGTTQNSNPATTEYVIQETGGNYVQGNGTLGATPVWQTAANWGTKTVTGLNPATTYTFQAKARNGANVETAFGGTVSGITLTPSTVDWCNLQYPTSQTIEEGNTFTVYARVNKNGITDSPGEGTTIDAWIGYSTTNGAPDNSWTWVSASYFGDDGTSNDEYSTLLGAGITPGTYYYVSRFSINGGPFVYGGKNNAIWASTADSAVLTVNPNLVDYCNVAPSGTNNVNEGTGFTITSEVYEPGITLGTGAGAGITAWIGYNSSNNNPNDTGWTWVSATYNAESGNNDVYKIDLPVNTALGTYYFASRYQKVGSTQYQYGGTNGSPWTTNGVLNVVSNKVDFCNIQSPSSGTITESMDFNVYAQVYENGLTTNSGQATAITAWIGYSTTDNNPSSVGWTWLATTFNGERGINNNNDEYTANIATGLTPGTYYYASRFQINGSTEFEYGGTTGVLWNNNSGVLTVEALGAPIATDATLVGETSFTANWDAVPNATSYEIDVYEQTSVLATDLFISEYVEGSSNNKYIEIFNGTGTSVDLSDYELRLYANGASTPTNANVLTGILANNTTIVYRNSGTTIYGGTTIVDSSTNFNGDDAVALYKISISSFVDIFGRIGNDPGTQWTGAGGYTTLDKTLVRKSSITSGITISPIGTGTSAFTTLTSEWDLYNIDVISGLGSHSFSGGSSTVYVFQNENIGSVISYEVTGLNPGTTYYYRVRAVLNSVTSGNSNVITVKPAVIWDGLAWSNTVGPDASTDAIIKGNFNTTDNGMFTAKSVTVNAGSLTVNSGKNITVVNGLINNLTANEVIIENNANLIQSGSTNLNSGEITVNRNSSALKRLDYTLWSSPVLGQGLYAFSKTTLPNRFYKYDTATDKFSNEVGFNLTNLQYPSPLVAPNGVNGTDANNVIFEAAKSYLIRTPWDHPTSATVWNGVFKGTPNNGDITYEMNTGYNAVGNPYPSTINVTDFINANISPTADNIDGTLWFWRKTNTTAVSTSYATLTKTAYVANGAAGGDTGTGFFNVGDEENWVISSGQGFIVNATNDADLILNNGMRRASNTDQFFKFDNQNNETKPDGIFWLNLMDNQGIYSQMALGYDSKTTIDFDKGYDGLNFNKDYYLASLIGNEGYSIQSRQKFESEDIVPLSYKVLTIGTYSISIDHKTGIFNNGQAIYLKDNLTNSLHNLSEGAYTFSSEVGNFINRFEIVYQNALAVSNPIFNENQVIVYKKNQELTINSGNVMMDSVKIFDIQGRLLFRKTNVNASEVKINTTTANEILLVKITSTNDEVVTKKVMN